MSYKPDIEERCIDTLKNYSDFKLAEYIATLISDREYPQYIFEEVMHIINNH